MAEEKKAAKEGAKAPAEKKPERKYADDERHGTPKEEDVAAEAVTAEGKKAKIDSKGRPETSEHYEGD